MTPVAYVITGRSVIAPDCYRPPWNNITILDGVGTTKTLDLSTQDEATLINGGCIAYAPGPFIVDIDGGSP